MRCSAARRGSASATRYYLHTYLKEQPDLNWRNPEVRTAMLDVLRFWIDRGVDGFRVDAMRQLLKDPDWRDNPPNPDWDGVNEYDSLLPVHTADIDEVQEVVAEIRRAIGDRLMVAEVYAPIERLVRYYGVDGRGAQLPFNFHLISTPWEAEAIAALIERYEAALPEGGWPNWVLGNHDRSRVATRVGPAQAGVAAMLLLTLRGTPTIYYGDEIGMTDVPIDTADPAGRDPERTPMQWDRGGAVHRRRAVAAVRRSRHQRRRRAAAAHPPPPAARPAARVRGGAVPDAPRGRRRARLRARRRRGDRAQSDRRTALAAGPRRAAPEHAARRRRGRAPARRGRRS